MLLKVCLNRLKCGQNSVMLVQCAVLSDIIGSYERNFSKHPEVKEFPEISMIWKSVPSQLAMENKKFLYI